MFAAASEAFSQRNINCSIAESIERFESVVAAAKAARIKVRAAVSVAVGCPYQGAVDPDEVERVVRLMKEIDQTIEKHGGWPAAFVTKKA